VSGTSAQTDSAAGNVRAVTARDLEPSRYRAHQLPFLAAVVIIAIFPPLLITDPYGQGLLLNSLISSILALGFYWCFSLAGQFSFAVAAFYGLGAYTSIWIANNFHGFWLGFIAATVICAIFGALMRLAFIRAQLIYFAIATMGLGSLLILVFQYWTSFTGGYTGTGKLVHPRIFGVALESGTQRYYLAAAVLVALLLLTVLFERSPAGRDLLVARDLGPVAATMRLRPQRATLVAFACGCAMQGMAGSLYAHTATYISLDTFQISVSLNVLLMLLLGGNASMYGPVVGAFLLTYLPEALHGKEKYADLIYALLVLVVIVIFPTGITGLRHQAATRYVRQWIDSRRRGTNHA
jgi:branched-chain amino acid transport system permease protein